MSAELDSKRLQLLHEIVPSVSRAAFLVNPNLTPSLDERFAKAEAAAKSLGITLRRVNAANPADLNTALPAIQASSSEALLVQNDPMLGPERSRISDFAVAHRLPTVFEGPGCGSARLGLFTYGSDLIENARLAAGYVSKILKGAKPADLGPATDEIPADCQPEDRQGARPDGPRHGPRPRRRGHRVKRRDLMLLLGFS